MREILFRGKRIGNQGWIEGCYIKRVVRCGMIAYVTSSYPSEPVKVHTLTLGQYIGLTDKNGNKIFEGDVVYYTSEGEYGQITYSEDEAMFMVEFDGWCTNFDYLHGKELEVVGNIHDNPELLKGGAE